MQIAWIAAPVIGGLIGLITNSLAIKMLFRPHRAIYIGRFRVPFTPGLIPKEKERIAGAIGEVISKYLLDRCKFLRYNEDDDYPKLYIIPEENESPEDLLNRGLDKCVEFIKNHKFKDDKKIYTYKDFLEYNEEENEGGIYYSRWDYTDMIHIEDRFKD